MTQGGHRLPYAAALLTAALIALVGCTSSEPAAEASEKAQPSGAANATSEAADCFSRVGKALTVTWGTASGTPSGLDEEEAMAGFLVDAQGTPEQGIYEEFRDRGLADLAKGQAEEGNEPASLLAHYAVPLKRSCADAYPQ